MNTASLPVLLMATVCCYVGLYYLVMFVRLRDQKENLFFALTCLSIGLYDVFCAGLYASRSVGEVLPGSVCSRQPSACFRFRSQGFYYFPRHPSRRPFFVSTIWFLYFHRRIPSWYVDALRRLPSIKHVSFAGLASVSYFRGHGPVRCHTLQYASRSRFRFS